MRGISRETAFLLVAFILGELAGQLLGFHEIVPEYDAIMHFVGGALVSSVIINFLVERLHQYSYITNVFATLGVGALWEIAEFAADAILGTALQPGLGDTMLDLIVVLSASVIINTIYWWRHVKRGLPVETA